MKKFLSLVLALVMTMSLVTISAGATEYDDFTDKDEIQYAEAVTVLNKLGIITGYSEGDFRPEGELTRGAAAKILVSLLIGPDAANALGNETSPYPDVPAGNTFAGVISYCKTAKIINGYGDGTFRPQGTLTGYAFAKMLLGALGYKSEYEGFTGAGWNMNVARLGGAAGLFDRISFNGNATVNREQACQLALNTLKGTMVEYSGGMNITNGAQSVVVNPDRNYKTSNQDYAQHINNKKVTNQVDDDYYTVEFGEEHFVDLRMERERTNADMFGRPSNVWSWKKVTIGTFPVEADFDPFVKQTEHSDTTDAAKNRATGLGNYKVRLGSGTREDPYSYTNLWVNGMKIDGNTTKAQLSSRGLSETYVDIYTKLQANNVAAISDLTDNGTVVEIYLDDDIADFISDIVVIQTQLMEVRRAGSDYVALQGYDNGNSDDYEKSVFSGYNNNAMNVRVENVQAEDTCYKTLSALKAGDIVAVVPVADDDAGTTWNVGDAYVPETVSGAITGVRDYGKTNADRHAIEVTVGGTAYNVAVWNKKLHDITADIIKATKKDVTLYLDKNGNAMLAKDIGATNDWMVVGNFRQALENGKIVNIVNGWDISGNAIELNVGTINYQNSGVRPGDLVKYSSTTSNTAEWRLDGTATGDVYNVFTDTDPQTSAPYQIKSSNTRIALETAGNTVTVDKSIKFIYVNFDEEDNEVESIEVKNGVQAVSNEELSAVYAGAGSDTAWNPAQGCVKNNAVKAIVVKGESNDAIATNMLYVRDYYGSSSYDSTGKMVYGYTVAMNTANDFIRDTVVYSYDRLTRGDFASYTAVENADHSEFYSLRRHNNFVGRTTSTYKAVFKSIIDQNNGFVRLGSTDYTWVNGSVTGSNEPIGVGVNGAVATDPGVVQVSTDKQSQLGIGNQQNIVDVKNANFIDLRPEADKKAPGREIDSYEDLKAVMMYGSTVLNELKVVMIVNDDPTKDSFRTVSMVVVLEEDDQNVTNTSTIKTLDSMAFRTLEWKAPATTETGTYSVDKAGDTSVTGRLNWTFTGKEAEVKLTPAGGAQKTITNGDMVTLKVGSNVIVARVKDEAGNWTSNYTFTITVTGISNESTTDRLNNKVPAADKDLDGADNLVFQADKSNISIDYANGNALSFPGLKDGAANSVKDQIEDALEFLGYTEVTVASAGGSNWTATGTSPEGVKERVNCDADSDIEWYVKIKVNGTDKYVADGMYLGGAADSTHLGLTGHIKMVTKDAAGDDVVTPIDSSDAATTAVVHGAAYTSDAYAKVQNLPAITGTGDTVFTAKFYKDSVAADNEVEAADVTAGVYLEKDAVVYVVLTKGAGDLDLSTQSGSAMDITFGKDAEEAVYSAAETKTNVIDSTNANAAKVVFKYNTGAGTLAAGETITASFKVLAADVTAGTFSYPTIAVTAGT